ncbi:MAG TPA: hypothetical protein VGX92_03635 [Pyrinomonadaceae bacterium]|jgi:hypothetical protein|nr:hypothetical protein [Pyrinomonadaceae bacterium]
MSKTKIILLTIAAWLIVCAYAAYHYVATILALPDIGPGYEQNWQFQFLMFLIVRFPFWFVGLIVIVLMEAVMLKPGPKKLK